jgi:Flp pilus assembly protein protease CpaA
VLSENCNNAEDSDCRGILKVCFVSLSAIADVTGRRISNTISVGWRVNLINTPVDL